MATAKKLTQADKIRTHAAAYPNRSIKEIAEKLGLRYQAVYQVLKIKPSVKVHKKVKPSWKNVMLATSKKAMVEHLGVTMAKDDVTKLTEEQTARLIFNNTQGRQRMQSQGLPYGKNIEMIEPQADNVNHPAHYKVGGIETIDFI